MTVKEEKGKVLNLFPQYFPLRISQGGAKKTIIETQM